MIKIAQPLIGSDECRAVERVLLSGSLSQGPEVAAFEQEFGSTVRRRGCVAVNSGTSALLLALLATGIGPGDEVIVPSFTFAATANAVVLAGAKPVFADISLRDYCLDPAAVAAAVTRATAAVIPVHLYGHPAPMPELMEVAQRYGLAVIEDAAQAHAATLHGRPVGCWGVAAAFSFYPTKNMTTGEGGMVVTGDPAIERRARLLRNQGMEVQYRNEIAGFNMRMTDLAAAIGRVQLRRLPVFNLARVGNAAHLSEELADIEAVVRPSVGHGATHVFHQYTVRVAGRDLVQQRLADCGVEARVYYPTPVHELPAYAEHIDLPATRTAAGSVLSLPVGPHLSPGDVDCIAGAVRQVTSSTDRAVRELA